MASKQCQLMSTLTHKIFDYNQLGLHLKEYFILAVVSQELPFSIRLMLTGLEKCGLLN